MKLGSSTLIDREMLESTHKSCDAIGWAEVERDARGKKKKERQQSDLDLDSICNAHFY